MRWRLKLPASGLFTQPFVQAQIKENIKALRHWPLWGEFTGDRWIPRTQGSNAENVSVGWRHHEIENYDKGPSRFYPWIPALHYLYERHLYRIRFISSNIVCRWHNTYDCCRFTYPYGGWFTRNIVIFRLSYLISFCSWQRTGFLSISIKQSIWFLVFLDEKWTIFL